MHNGTICFRPVADEDLPFLSRVYAATRFQEMTTTGWSDSHIETFLQIQFECQHAQYVRNYPGAAFNIIVINGTPAGRLYVDRTKNNMRIIDIALLPKFRGRGTGGEIMRGLAREADAEGLGMSLHVEMNNPVRGWYEKLGFRVTELRGIYYYLERDVNQFQGNQP